MSPVMLSGPAVVAHKASIIRVLKVLLMIALCIADQEFFWLKQVPTFCV